MKDYDKSTAMQISQVFGTFQHADCQEGLPKRGPETFV